MQINLLFRVSTFHTTNGMTSARLAGAMLESLAHHSGNKECESGLTVLIDGAAHYFTVHTLWDYVPLLTSALVSTKSCVEIH